jgi:hypothetical protein
MRRAIRRLKFPKSFVSISLFYDSDPFILAVISIQNLKYGSSMRVSLPAEIDGLFLNSHLSLPVNKNAMLDCEFLFLTF